MEIYLVKHRDSGRGAYAVQYDALGVWIVRFLDKIDYPVTYTTKAFNQYMINYGIVDNTIDNPLYK